MAEARCVFLGSELMNLGVESKGDLRWCHDVGTNICHDLREKRNIVVSL